jgi:RimJ/RimL family protein N-acetyltransferase
MICITPLEKKDVSSIIAWNEGKGADFLTQWAGRGYRYPLMEEQITERLIPNPGTDFKIYGIILDGKILGTIELMKIDFVTKRASIGHFLVDPAETGKGYGTEALQLFVKNVFTELPVDTLELNVFDFNRTAILCYQKVGFIKTGKVVRPNGWVAINMEIRRKDL